MRESDHEPKIRTSYREMHLNGAGAGAVTNAVTTPSTSREWGQSSNFSSGTDRDAEAKVGRNEGTVRFLFEPPGYEVTRD